MQDRSPGAAAPRGGRPRDTHIDRAVLLAADAVLQEAGYRGFSVEEVARRAGTTKAAVYRRFPRRQELVLAALAARLGEVEAPDTDCTLCDLSEGLVLFVRAFERMPPDVLSPLLSDCAGDEGLRSRFMATLFDPPREAAARTLRRAGERGDLRPEVDEVLLLDLLASLVHYRVLFGHASLTEGEIAAAVEVLLAGAATDYAGLLEKAEGAESSSSAHHRHASAAG